MSAINSATADARLALLWPDILIAGLFALTGYLLGIPILLALAVYVALNLAQDAVSVVLSGHAQGRNAHRYEFGTGKLEQAANLTPAAIKVAAGLWLVYWVSVGERMLGSIPAQGELRLCALVSALYSIRCIALAWTVRGANRKPLGTAARTRAFTASAFQAAITIAAVAKDAFFVGLALSAAKYVLAFALLLPGILESRNAVLDLVDHPLDFETGKEIREVVASLEEADKRMIVDIRGRRSGTVLFIELTITPWQQASLDEIGSRISNMRDKFKRALPDSDIVFHIAKAPFVSSG